MKWPGEEKLWESLLKMDPEETAVNSAAAFDHDSSSYSLTCFGQNINISLKERNISGGTVLGAYLIKELAEYSRLSILSYLINAKDARCSGELVKPADLPCGNIFLKGTHALPLKKISERFDNRYGSFLETGKALGGAQVEYGDAALQLFPFPRVPIVFILWSGDEEFPPEASLLFDSHCASFLPIDIIWATAMMSILLLLKEP